MRRVILESPYAGKTPADVAAHVEYARHCVSDCLRRGETPLAGHLLYTQVLDDKDPKQRRKGLDAHLAWIEAADALVVYDNLGITSGMKEAIVLAQEHNTTIEFRSLPDKLIWPRLTMRDLPKIKPIPLDIDRNDVFEINGKQFRIEEQNYIPGIRPNLSIKVPLMPDTVEIRLKQLIHIVNPKKRRAKK